MGGLLQGMEIQSLLLISPPPPVISKEDSFLGGLVFFKSLSSVDLSFLPLLPPGDTQEHPLQLTLGSSLLYFIPEKAIDFVRGKNCKCHLWD